MKKQKITILHNTRCSKSRCALELLEKKKADVEVIEYLKEVPTREELKLLLAKLNMKPFELVRQEEQLFKDKYKKLKLNDHEWIRVMLDNPILIQRPIVVRGNKAIIARPVELIDDLF
ncbi:MAG: arsenate reductase (glutaredoxin) [Flavobacteriales bacterium]